MSYIKWVKVEDGDYDGYFDDETVGRVIRHQLKGGTTSWLPIIFNEDGTSDALSENYLPSVESAFSILEAEVERIKSMVLLTNSITYEYYLKVKDSDPLVVSIVLTVFVPEWRGEDNMKEQWCWEIHFMGSVVAVGSCLEKTSLDALHAAKRWVRSSEAYWVSRSKRIEEAK